MKQITWTHPFTSKLDNMKKGTREVLFICDKHHRQLSGLKYYQRTVTDEKETDQNHKCNFCK